jgi:acetyltransferase-like isoleucine patch superfamily enzyme
MDIKRAWESFRYASMFSSVSRGKYIKKKGIFGAIGENVRLPSGIIPLRAEYIFLHNNIEIASGARLIPHDAIHSVLSNMDGENYPEHIGKIEIFDNVFIGANALIIGPVKIGKNVIVAAGAVVVDDVASGTVVGGVPAKVIGKFEDLKNVRKKRD